jgi:hypothetical protein
MNIQIKYLVALVVLSMVVGGAITSKFVQSKSEVKTQIVDHVVTQDHVVTVVKEVDHPDGTKEITTTKDDTSVKHDTSVTNKDDIKAKPLPNWMVSGGVGLTFDGTVDRVYKAEIQRRILGPVFIGAYGTTKSEVGLSVGFEF